MTNTTSTIKVTKRDNFNAIIKVLADNGKDDLVKVMEHEIELMDNKNSKRASKRVDNSIYTDKVRDALATGGKTPSELIGLLGVDNTQKVASIMKSMGDMVSREAKGKKVIYTLA